VLKERLTVHLQIERQALQLEDQLLKTIGNRYEVICKLTDGMIACASDMTSEVYTNTVSSNGNVLCGSVRNTIAFVSREM